MISKEDEHVFRKQLVAANMAELVREDAVPRTSCGRKLLAGMLSVEHKKGRTD